MRKRKKCVRVIKWVSIILMRQRFKIRKCYKMRNEMHLRYKMRNEMRFR